MPSSQTNYENFIVLSIMSWKLRCHNKYLVLIETSLLWLVPCCFYDRKSPKNLSLDEFHVSIGKRNKKICMCRLTPNCILIPASIWFIIKFTSHFSDIIERKEGKFHVLYCKRINHLERSVIVMALVDPSLSLY